MYFLIFSILASVSVAALLKMARKRGWLIEQMVAVNYVMATALTLLFLQPNMANLAVGGTSLGLFAILGVLLPTVFVAMGRAVAVAGIVKSDAAQRLSLFLPVLAAFTIFGEAVVAHRVAGLALAVVALGCLLYKRDGGGHAGGFGWLLAVWLGYGVIDILFKQLSKLGSAFASSLLVVFVLAGVLMFGYLWWRKTRWQWVHVWVGLLLGMLNFMNILFYIKAHQAFKDSPTLVFASMNMGVIVLGTLVGMMGFGERVSRLNVVGVVLALGAIWMLYFGNSLF